MFNTASTSRRIFDDPMMMKFVGNSPDFPQIVPSHDHFVLYNIRKNNSTDPPYPFKGRHVWNNDYVRMPFAKENNFVRKDNKNTIYRWNLINASLRKTIRNSFELEDAILSYNHAYRNEWKFNSLHRLFNEHLNAKETEEFFDEILPLMKELALSLPDILQSPIPLLKQRENLSISLSQLQIASLLANAFFCTFPWRNSKTRESEYSSYPSINFNGLYQIHGSDRVLEKLKCILHYFRRVCKESPAGVVTFSRRFVDNEQCPDWSESDKKIGSIPIYSDSKGSIEDEGFGLLQVDFANKFVGGGVLGNGCVQEEIRFVISPELLVSRLFTEVLGDTEALLIIGSERYSSYSGYSDTFKWKGNYVDETKRDSSGRRKCSIIVIDALNFKNPWTQYEPKKIFRELNKAWIGFTAGPVNHSQELEYPGVATGNWGCGAFKGSPQLKFLLQMMACCEARRPMAYFTFGNTQQKTDFENIYNQLSVSNVTVGQLFHLLYDVHKSGDPGNQLFSYILSSISKHGNNDNNYSKNKRRYDDYNQTKENNNSSKRRRID